MRCQHNTESWWTRTPGTEILRTWSPSDIAYKFRNAPGENSILYVHKGRLYHQPAGEKCKVVVAVRVRVSDLAENYAFE